MKFGADLKNSVVPEWAPGYIAYDALKAQIKAISGAEADERDALEETFFATLEEELEKVNRFYLQKIGEFDAALAALERLVDYEVGEVTAAATFYVAEVYAEFSRSLLESERPPGLGESELRDYEAVLDEEAFPFEERAIEVHQKNLELLAEGLYNRWIQSSLDRLAHLVPGRFAKFEASSGLIGSIDGYSYRPPDAPRGEPQDVPATEPAGVTDATPM